MRRLLASAAPPSTVAAVIDQLALGPARIERSPTYHGGDDSDVA
jgi:hypothetical protein